jgi:hypothetical protein
MQSSFDQGLVPHLPLPLWLHSIDLQDRCYQQINLFDSILFQDL